MNKIYYYDYLNNKNPNTNNLKIIIKQLGYELIEINYKNYKEELIDKNPTNSIIILNWVENASGINNQYIQYCFNWAKIINSKNKNGNKIIFVYHNQYTFNINMLSIKYLFKKYFVEYLLKNSDAIQILSSNAMSIIKEPYKNKTFSIPHSTYINAYGPTIKHNNNEYLNLLLFGMIKKYKNIEKIIEIAKYLINKKIRFIICGNISDENYYKKILKASSNLSNIEIIPEYIADEKMSELFSKCDAFVLPYHKNSCLCSGVMILAASYQKTFVCSAIPAAKDMPADLTYVYDYQNNKTHIKNLKEEIIKMYNDKINKPDILKEKGIQLQNYLIKNHSEQIISEGYKRMFKYLNNKVF